MRLQKKCNNFAVVEDDEMPFLRDYKRTIKVHNFSSKFRATAKKIAKNLRDTFCRTLHMMMIIVITYLCNSVKYKAHVTMLGKGN